MKNLAIGPTYTALHMSRTIEKSIFTHPIMHLAWWQVIFYSYICVVFRVPSCSSRTEPALYENVILDERMDGVLDMFKLSIDI